MPPTGLFVINIVCCVGRVEIQMEILDPLWRRANAWNVRLYYPYWQYTDIFIFRFVVYLYLHAPKEARLFTKTIYQTLPGVKQTRSIKSAPQRLNVLVFARVLKTLKNKSTLLFLSCIIVINQWYQSDKI